ncbi:replication initiator [Pseudonocardia asaccharolytica]|uniref:Plasmid replication initiator protein n=1 Tax=Pseudonocardia asaccharolytica DSM 44247 = NBRC 16224 TaxID=1123024 RepID=A0A511D1H0_9PSEU|nr:replication initiator [Pseudonocardia asaccharolytica]GEL18621.1 plasmid replication initiator protein [Pseudonocardia asaccharolytica DSM 44247 = NBRC 16224]
MTAAAPTPALRSGHERTLLRRAGSPGLGRWLAHTASTRGCVRPVRLTGSVHTVERATGRVVETRHTHTMPDGVLYAPCGDRRASVCPPCAETYRADTFQLIKAGLVGGKGVPASVSAHPAVFATATAPSFGPVHTRVANRTTGKVRPCHMRRDIRRCPHGKPLVCTQRHTEHAPCLGRPLCLDCYDHAHHVVWNGWAGELWRRTMIALARSLRPLERRHGVKLRVSYGKVAEYQRRGVVHFHALLRLDQIDPADPDAILPPPAEITADHLAELVAAAVANTGFRTPDYADTGHSWPIHWGPQLDVRPVAHLGTGEITPEAVAGYLAKYATKATEPTGLPLTGRMTAETAEYYSDGDTHLGRLVAYAWQLGARPREYTTDQQKRDWHDTYGRLRRWTHMLGFGGHFATKSRRYSTTHKALRAARRTWRRTQQAEWRARHGLDHHDEETTLIVCDLTLAGIGWPTTADAQLAAGAAARAREHRQRIKEERATA